MVQVTNVGCVLLSHSYSSDRDTSHRLDVRSGVHRDKLL